MIRSMLVMLFLAVTIFAVFAMEPDITEPSSIDLEGLEIYAV